MGTKLYVKSQRAFRIPSESIIEGGRLGTDKKFNGYIDPDTIVEVTDEQAKLLKAGYPDEFMDLAELAKRSPKEKAKLPEKVVETFESGDRK
jgi:hypothetical protein